MAAMTRTIQHDFYVYVDTVVLTVNPGSENSADSLEVLVMHRPEARQGVWALPGGAVRPGERLEDTAIRKVHEETNLSVRLKDLHQVGAFGDPDRDDRFRAISIAYVALVPHPGQLQPNIHSDDARFVPLSELRRKSMEFDHFAIIEAARRTAGRMLEDTNIALSFCRPRFTMTELRRVYEAFLQEDVDAANFRRKVEAVAGFVEEVAIRPVSTSRGRPPMEYRAGRTRELSPPIRFRTGSSLET